MVSVENILAENEHSVAAIIVEPVAGNMGCIAPEKGFLESLRKLANRYGTLLIFDEVMTGFRLAAGGAQEVFDVHADLITFGKIIGGGFPVGAIAGTTSLMDLLAPAGPVYQAGTLSGNPIATTAGITVLTELKENPKIYETLENIGEKLEKGLLDIFRKNEIAAQINRVGSMISVFFSKERINTFSDVKKADMDMFSAFFHQMLENGIHLPPSGFESWFLATTLIESLIDQTLEATEKSIQQIKIEIA